MLKEHRFLWNGLAYSSQKDLFHQAMLKELLLTFSIMPNPTKNDHICNLSIEQ
jgi:hypothetical protein